ncbi:MAG TPA: hypothetical protein VIY28_14485, partial [Pseudonocardiaceae bacterium]
YHAIIAEAFAANPDPPPGRKRDYLQRASFNLAVALRDHADEILRFTADLAVPFDNYADVVVMPICGPVGSGDGPFLGLSSA